MKLGFGFPEPSEDRSLIENAPNYATQDLANMLHRKHCRSIRSSGTDLQLFTHYSRALLEYRIFPPELMRARMFSSPSGVVILQNVRIGPMHLSAAVRILEASTTENAEESRTTLRYGTLHGHPEQGEACFSLIWRKSSGSLEFEIETRSRPAGFLQRVLTPLNRMIQARYTERAIDFFCLS